MEFPYDFDDLDFPSFAPVPDSSMSMAFPLYDLDSHESVLSSMDFYSNLGYIDSGLSIPTHNDSLLIHNVSPTINQNPPLNCLGGAQQTLGHVSGVNLDEQVALTIPMDPVSHSSQLDDIDSVLSIPSQNGNNGSLLIHKVNPAINQNLPLNCLGHVNLDEQVALTIPMGPFSHSSQLDEIDSGLSITDQNENNDSLLIYNVSAAINQSPTLNCLGGAQQTPRDPVKVHHPSRHLQQALFEDEWMSVEPSNQPAEEPPFIFSAQSNRPTTYVVDPTAPANRNARMVHRPEWRAVFRLVESFETLYTK